jgi:hypothetical protein
MKGAPIDHHVFAFLYPSRTQRDPTNFTHYVQRHLVPEVRREVLSYFGHLDTDEARYPGLDYTNRIHRVRLSRWRHHRDLFRAFDALRLTPNEISGLTRWEGTKWAKDNHETRRREPIPNTAADHMPHWGYGDARPTSRITGRPVPPRTLRSAKERFAGIAEDAEYEIERASRPAPRHDSSASAFGSRDASRLHAKNDADAMGMYVIEDDEEERGEDGDETEVEEEKEEEEEDEVMASVGVPLNQHLRTQAARRNAGDTSAVMDAEWEAWYAYFKSSLEPTSPLGSPTYMAAAAAAAAAAASTAPDCPTPPTAAPSASQSTPRSLLRQQQQRQQHARLIHQQQQHQHHAHHTQNSNIQQSHQQSHQQPHQQPHHHAHRMLEPVLPQMLAAARAGRWHEIPPHRQEILRQLVSEQQHHHWTEPDEVVRVPARA